jgi:hypothetical protein
MMESNNIKFISNRFHLNENSPSVPEASSKLLVDWYKKADRFGKDESGEYVVAPDGGKVSTWKSCPAVLDVMTTGYMLKTPCDIEFFLNQKNKISVRIENKKCYDFCTPRDPLPQFYQPDGYYLDHFAWFIDWGIELPPGYSALYLTPMNRFDLPFINTVGIIDNDKVHLSGALPFFIREGWTGIIPAGTPYVQILPFKRENWKSEIVIEDQKLLPKKNIENTKKYRVPNGGVYKNEIWEKRIYE